MKMKRFIYVFFCLCFTANAFSYGKEHIISFHSNIQVDTTGKVIIAEQIEVYANNDDIKRGIVRSLPVYRTDIDGKKQKMSFSILAVQRDGHRENYQVEAAGDFWDIYIGNSNVILEPGIYTFSIIYETYGQVGFFDDYDEIYWNVTGNDWQFDIEQASATIILPDGIPSIRTACYTGSFGSSASDCISEIGSEKEIHFKTKTSLQSGEGFTVAVSFPRDIILRPPPPSKAELFWLKYRHIIISVSSLLIMLFYGFFSWRKAGRDPDKPVVIPQFSPPNNWSPSIVRYLYKKGCDNKTFTAALVNMAVKGAIRIKEDSKKFSLTVINREALLPDEERAVFQKLFSSSDTLQISDKNHLKFSEAFSLLKTELEGKQNLKDYFLKNIGYIVSATLMVIVAIIINVAVSDFNESIIIIFLGSLLVLCGLMIMIAALKQFKWSNIFMFLIGCVFFIPGIGMLIPSLLKENNLLVIFIIVVIALYALYIYLIKAPTKLGSKTISELEGFRMYLKTAEEDDLNLLTPPEHTPELFEKLLPYAIALDVENEWAEKFDGILKRVNYQPQWYNGDKPFHPYVFAGVFAGTFTSSLQRAQINPTTSSGSSGEGSWSSGSSMGGFSGGGGGGGGGRGW